MDLTSESRGILGHELRTPLAVLKGSLQMAQRQPHRRDEWIGLALSQVESLTGIVGQLEVAVTPDIDLRETAFVRARESAAPLL